jgi:hypothetical protein
LVILVVLLEKWQREGITPSPLDVDVVNETTRMLCNAIAPRAAAQLAVACAEAIDAAIDNLTPTLLTEVETTGCTVHLNRAEYRHEHLTQIEHALGLSQWQFIIQDRLCRHLWWRAGPA